MEKTDRPSRRMSIAATCAWGLLGALFGYYYSQFITKIGWNAIELIIAQHLLGHGAYVTGLDYPTSIAWRPIVPTFIVTGVRLLTENPLEVYQTVCGLAFASMGASSFLAGKRLWGWVAGHTAAALCLACPAITTYLVHHIHSYSHIGMMLVLAPTLLVALSLLREEASEAERRPWLYGLCGTLWGLSYLCRSELLLFASIHFVALAVVHWRAKFKWKLMAFAVVPFLILAFAYNTYADYICKRQGILVRNPIYSMYISQGWADPPPNVGPDIEGDGYQYAIRLYGTPASNGESLVRAIRHNPDAFLRRVRINLRNFYLHYWDDAFFPRVYALAVGAAFILYLVRLLRGVEKNPIAIPFLLLLFVASHFVLMLHIDARYLTINVLPLIFIATYAFAATIQLVSNRIVKYTITGLVVVLMSLQARRQWDAVRHHDPRNEVGIIAMRGLANHFNSLGFKRSTQGNKEPHILFEFPAQSPIAPEDQFLLAYFTDTAWVNGGAEGPFPRGKFYSFKDSPIDYRYVPAEKISAPHIMDGMHIVSDCENPVLGKYFLLQANPPGVTLPR